MNAIGLNDRVQRDGIHVEMPEILVVLPDRGFEIFQCLFLFTKPDQKQTIGVIGNCAVGRNLQRVKQ